MYEKFVKRGIDVFLSFMACIVLAPFYLLIMLAIKIDSKGPVFFKQRRIGKDCKEFNILKFRTMRIDTPHDMPTHLLENPEQYITHVGKFIRKTSLDELPQLFNVLKGDMSLVGPRPPLPREVEQYTEDQKQRMYVTPGLTCYWQIQPNRNQLSFDEWLELDIKYINERSFLTDWKIIFATIRTVIGMTGA